MGGSYAARIKAEGKSLRASQAADRKRRRAQKSAQGSIDYDLMFEDGVCQVCPGVYSKSLWFSDVNYQAARDDEQSRIFRKYMEMLNRLDGASTLQLSIVNHQIDPETFSSKVLLEERGDALDPYRRDYNRVLAAKSREGSKNVSRERYLTFTCAAPTYAKAVPTLARLEASLSEDLGQIGCTSRALTGPERLGVISDIFAPGEPFEVDYAELGRSLRTTKDAVAPNGLDFSASDRMRVGERFAQVLYFAQMPAVLPDRLVSEIADMPFDMAISIQARALDAGGALRKVVKKTGQMRAERVNAQKEARDQNLFTEHVSQELISSIEDANMLLSELRDNGQKMFKVTCLVMVSADTAERLEDAAFQIVSTAAKHALKIEPLRFMQRAGMNSTLPLGLNHVPIQRTHVTASLAALMPFATQELVQMVPGAMYYGQNQLSNQLILAARGAFDTPMGWVLGKPGSGKSFYCKREMNNCTLGNPEDEILCIDPEDEYASQIRAYGGEVVDIAADSSNYLNPFDLSSRYGDTSNPVAFKSEFVQTICDLLAGGKMGLDAVTLSVVDRVVAMLYADVDVRGGCDEMPTFIDFRKLLLEQPEPEARYLATALERYITGSLSVFTHRTNVDAHARIVSYNTKRLGKQLKMLGMLIVIDQVWNRILENYERGVRTWVYIDEAQTFFDNPMAMKYFDDIYSRSRKYLGIPTGITQNVTRVLDHEVGRQMLMNSGFVVMLNQSPNDARALADLFELSKQQQSYFTNAKPGHGLLLADGKVIAFKDDFPKGRLYDLFTTKPEDVIERNRARFAERMRAREQGDETPVLPRWATEGRHCDDGGEVLGARGDAPAAVPRSEERPAQGSPSAGLGQTNRPRQAPSMFENSPLWPQEAQGPAVSPATIITPEAAAEANARIDAEIRRLYALLDEVDDGQVLSVLERISMLRAQKRDVCGQ